MRITQVMIARTGVDQLTAQRNRLARTQEMAATGKRINRPSDDPVDYRTVLFLKDSLGQTDRFLRSIDLAKTRIQTTESALDGAYNVLNEVRAKAVEAGNSVTLEGQVSRDAIKIQLEGLFDELLSFANVRSAGGSYVFSGRDASTPAYSRTGDFGPGTVPTVTYDGDPRALEVEIDDDIYIEVTRDGQAAFQGSGDVFVAVTDLWTAVDQADVTGVQDALTRIDAGMTRINLERAELGGSGKKAESFEERLRLQQENITSRVSFLEDADAFEVYTDLAAQETALQASLQVTSRLLQPTLLDYI